MSRVEQGAHIYCKWNHAVEGRARAYRQVYLSGVWRRTKQIELGGLPHPHNHRLRSTEHLVNQKI